MKGNFIVAAIPAYNEEAKIGEVIRKVRMYVNEVIVCDDGSTDRTYRIAKDSGAIVVRHKRNMGYGATLSTLFQEARKLNPEMMITLDADGQHNPAYIPRIVKPVLQDSADIVIGSRFLSSDSGGRMPPYRKFGVWVITKLARKASYNGITDAQSGFRAYSRKALQMIRPSERGMGASTEILIEANRMGLRVSEMPVVVSYEGKTSKENPLVHLFEVVMSTLKHMSKKRPQAFPEVLGIAALTLALGFWGVLASVLLTGRNVDMVIALLAFVTTVISLCSLTFSASLRKLAIMKEPRE